MKLSFNQAVFFVQQSHKAKAAAHDNRLFIYGFYLFTSIICNILFDFSYE